MLGPLTLGARTLRWPNLCGKGARRIKLVTDSGQQAAYPAFEPPTLAQLRGSGQQSTAPASASQAADYMPQALIDLTADGAPPCYLTGDHITYLRLKLGSIISPGDVCEMEMTFYGYEPESGNKPQTRPEFLAWSTFNDERFIPDKGLFLPCPAAQRAQAAASSAAKAAWQ
jgi:hypothetical protein